MLSGARRGELLSLRRDDVDLERGVAQLSRSNNGDRRTLVLLPQVVAALRPFASDAGKHHYSVACRARAGRREELQVPRPAALLRLVRAKHVSFALPRSCILLAYCRGTLPHDARFDGRYAAHRLDAPSTAVTSGDTCPASSPYVRYRTERAAFTSYNGRRDRTTCFRIGSRCTRSGSGRGRQLRNSGGVVQMALDISGRGMDRPRGFRYRGTIRTARHAPPSCTHQRRDAGNEWL